MKPRGRLLVVATPLGNLADITARASEALRGCDLVACEDTRRTRVLLAHLGVTARALSYHKFNEASRLDPILGALAEGKTVALVTDAGTPGISDPGARLVSAARSAGAGVEAIPGPSAPAAAVSVSGFESPGYLFAGYPPPRGAARRRFLAGLRAAEAARASADPGAEPLPLVFFEAPHRIEACLDDLRAELGDRRAVLIREMTKLHEETLSGSLSGIAAALRDAPRRGEFTIVVEGRSEPEIREVRTPSEIREAYRGLLASGVDRREALRMLARSTGVSRRDLYKVIAGHGTEAGEG